MNVAEIPSDQIVEMTPLLHSLFRAGGCDPICHCCCKKLKVGLPFKLATVDTHVHPHLPLPGTDSAHTVNSGISIHADGLEQTREVMLCDACTVEKMNKRTKAARAKYNRYRAQGGGCHRVNGQIVH